jgi:galactose mutarotase-like enzyme
MITIQNELISAAFKVGGGELCSLKALASGREFVWQADAAHWKRHAPVLFPIVGRLQNDTYTVDNHSYRLPQHGFARDRDFHPIHQTASELTFYLGFDHHTKKIYPFEFELLIRYVLEDSALRVEYTVKNVDKKTIYFSIGAHPAFNCPARSNEKRSDYYFEFEKEESAPRYKLLNGTIDPTPEKVIENGNRISIRDDLFAADALIFKDIQSQKLALKHQSGQELLHLTWENMPYLGLWSPSQEAPFVCIEPWHGIADMASHHGKLPEEEGIVAL